MKDGLESGAALRRQVQGPKSETLQDGVKDLDAGLADWVDGFVFGDVWQRPGLSTEERLLTAVAMLASARNHDQLRAYLFGAVHNDVPPRKVQEVLAMVTVYAGFPSAIQALTVWHDVVAACRRQGFEVDL